MSRHGRSQGEYDLDDLETFELASLLPDDGEHTDDALPRVKPLLPFPKLQVSVLLILYFAAPIGGTFRSPFIVELISGLNIAPKEVGYYSGILDSLSAAGEAISVLQWGRLSDKIGRRPVLIACTLGVASTLISFGLSTTFTRLALSRAFEGLLSGNSGTIKAMLAELTAGDEHQMARVFSLMPVVWAVGAAIGPVLGGSLANPSVRFPNAFSGSLWKEHPYLLACFASVVFAIVGFLAVFFFLKETVTTTHDYIQFSNGAEPEESLLSIPPSRDYLHPQKPSFLSRRLFFTLVNYAFLSFLDASLYATYPLLLASPIASGGLNFAPKTIGYILGTAALCHALIQALCFPSIIKRWDARNVYAASIVAYVFLFLTMPILNALARHAGHVTPVIWGLLSIDVITCFSSYSAYSCMYIFLSQAAPTQSALGRTHGLGQTVAAVTATIAPATATSLVALSLQHNLLGGALGYLLLAGMGILALGLTSLLPAVKRVVPVKADIGPA